MLQSNNNIKLIIAKRIASVVLFLQSIITCKQHSLYYLFSHCFKTKLSRFCKYLLTDIDAQTLTSLSFKFPFLVFSNEHFLSDISEQKGVMCFLTAMSLIDFKLIKILIMNLNASQDRDEKKFLNYVGDLTTRLSRRLTLHLSYLSSIRAHLNQPKNFATSMHNIIVENTNMVPL